MSVAWRYATGKPFTPITGATFVAARNLWQPSYGSPNAERASSSGLFDTAQRAAAALGLAPLSGVEVGGGSDGNFTAALGVPTLDGLGAVGEGAHALQESILINRIADRTALLAKLVAAI